MVSLVQSSPSAVTNVSSGATIVENTNPGTVVEQLRLTPQAVDDIVAQSAVIAKADMVTQQQHALASMGFEDDDVRDMLDLATEAQAQGITLDGYPELKRIVDEMASRLQAFTIIDKHKQDANPALVAEVSRGLKQETLQATLSELDLLAADLGYEPEDEPVLVDKAVRKKESVQQSLNDGLLAYYSFNHGDARNDLDTEYVDGIAFNGVVLSPGVLGASFWFDGIDDRMRLDHRLANGLNSFSISFWFNTNSISSGNSYILSAASSNNDNELIFSLKQDNTFDVWRAGHRIMTDGSLNKNVQDGFWHHIVFSAALASNAVYLDGEMKVLCINNDYVQQVDYNGLWVGGEQDSVGGNWDSSQQYIGKLDEILFFNRELTPSEVLFLSDISNFDEANPWWLASSTATPSPLPPPPSTPASASPNNDIHIDRDVFMAVAGAFAALSAGAMGLALYLCACKQRQDAAQNSHQQLVDEDTPRAVAVNVEMVRPSSSVSQAPHAVLFQSAPVNHNQRRTEHTNKAWNSCSML